MLFDRIKRLCATKGVSISQMERDISISRGAAYKWKTSSPSRDILERLSDYFGVSIDDILERENDIPAKPNRLPVYGSVPAGIPLEAITDIEDWEEIPYAMLDEGQYIGLKVKGNSMFPKYLDGDTIIIKVQPDCESGQDAVVYVNGYDATLKKVIKYNDGIMLQPLNPEYEPKMYRFEDGENPVRILGVVAEIRRKV